jgi:hypothetical protein
MTIDAPICTSTEMAARRRERVFDTLCNAIDVCFYAKYVGVLLFGAGLLAGTPDGRVVAAVGLIFTVVCGVGARLLDNITDRVGDSFPETPDGEVA